VWGEGMFWRQRRRWSSEVKGDEALIDRVLIESLARPVDHQACRC
jgi:hypothetical protein